MRIIIQFLVIVWTIFSLAVSSTFANKDIFSSKKTSKNRTNHTQSVLLNQWDAKYISISLWLAEDIQVDENKDNKEEDKKFCGAWKTKIPQLQSLGISTTIKNCSKQKKIRKLNIVWINFTDLVWIIKITF